MVPATTFLLLFGSTRTLPTAWYCGNWPAGSVYAGPKTSAPSTVQCRAGVGGLEDALAAHREGAVVQVAGAGIDRVVVVRIDGEGVDRVVEMSGSSVVTVQVVEPLQQLVVFQTPPPTVAA